MNTTHLGMIHLLKSAVTGQRESLPQDFSLEAAWEIITKQGLLPLAYEGALNSGISKEHPVMKRMFLGYYQQLLRSERQMQAINKLFQGFEDAGIDYMPVKGCNLKYLYPKPELRPMGDADILIRETQLPQCAEILKSQDFTLKLESEHTDNWQSDALYVELHKSLVPPEDADYYTYYGDGWRFAVKGAGFRYDPTPEDTFIFLFTHFARHYRESGIGCRHVLDLYVYLRANPGLNQDYIRAELKKLRLAEFYTNVLRLLDVWFGAGAEDEISLLMTSFIFSGGTWGTMESGLYARELRSVAKRGRVSGSSARSWIRVVFPPLSTLKNRYQILLRIPALLPVMWVVRWVDVALFSRRKLRRKLRILRQISDKSVLEHRQLMDAVGLEFWEE